MRAGRDVDRGAVLSAKTWERRSQSSGFGGQVISFLGPEESP